jgi:hypothetical protein
MFTAYIAVVIFGSCVLVLLPESGSARVIRYAIYAVIVAGFLFFVALVYGQYAAHAPL